MFPMHAEVEAEKVELHHFFPLRKEEPFVSRAGIVNGYAICCVTEATAESDD